MKRPEVVAAFALLSAVLVFAGRFTVPGHDLTGWPGVYEFLAHAWVGAMTAVVVNRWKEPEGNFALTLLVALSVFELAMFLWR